MSFPCEPETCFGPWSYGLGNNQGRDPDKDVVNPKAAWAFPFMFLRQMSFAWLSSFPHGHVTWVGQPEGIRAATGWFRATPNGLEQSAETFASAMLYLQMHAMYSPRGQVYSIPNHPTFSNRI